MSSFVRKFQKKDIELMLKLGNTPFFSGYWGRVRIDKAIASAAPNAHGTLLDIGCGRKPYFEVFKPFVKTHLGIEYSNESVYCGHKADVFGDAMKLPFGDNTVDTILCTEVLEHIPNPEKAIAEFARILRPKGIVIITAPFCYPVHDAWDFYRYSPDGISNILERNDMEIIRVTPLSGTAVTIALLFNMYWFDLGFMWTKWLYPIGLLLRPLLLLLCFFVNMLGWIFEKILPAGQLPFNHLTIARKK